MKLRLATCRAVGCQHVISARMLFCPEHWAMVPAELRREVMVSAAAKSQGAQGAAGRYGDAVARAVASVKAKQERKAQASAGSSGSLFT
jgi:hypothetical protein